MIEKTYSGEKISDKMESNGLKPVEHFLAALDGILNRGPFTHGLSTEGGKSMVLWFMDRDRHVIMVSLDT